MVEAMEIQNGYKQTEVGIIPSDWVPATVGDLIRFEGGSQPPLSTFSSFQHEHYIRLIQIRDYKTDKYMTFIPEKLARKKCAIDEIMIGRYGPPIFQILKGLEGAYNVALIKAIPNENLLIRYYAFHFLKQKKLFHFIEKLSQRSGGQTGIDIIELRKFPFPLPPTKAEQTAIVTALNDADALITQLEKLIAKKRNIKQGAMQELLKPKDGWEFKLLGEVADFSNGKAHEQFIDENGNYIVVNSKFISTEGCVVKHSNQNICPLFKGDITIVMSDIPNGKALAKCFIIDIDNKYTLNQRIGTIRPKAGNSKYYFYQLNRNKYFLSFDSGTGQTNMRKNEILDCPVPLPPTINEQTKIAQILSDMNAEIVTLEKKLEKYKMIKQGMMQNLLTGKIRLV
jgi:type I restriction enzyme S subunit